MNTQRIQQMEVLQEKESCYGRVLKIDGSLVVIENIKDAELFELVKVGQNNIFGEIIKLEGEKAYVQCYEDTSCLTVGDPTIQTKSPLSVELGPGIFTSIFDGIQRQLQEVEEGSQTFYIPKNVNVLGLDQNRVWEFKPSSTINLGSIISGGDIFGSVFENNLIEEHKILTSPTVQGRVTYLAPAGNYTLQDKLLEVELNDQKYQYGMSHLWPVRQPRPILEKLQSNTPLITGVRVLDGLFSSSLGGTCCISGPAQCGQLGLSFTLTENQNTQCMIFIGCAESGNQMADVLIEFPELTTQYKDKQENIRQRTCLVANPSNTSLAKRNASIYTGTTFAEYFRDMGLDVTLIADQTLKWVENSTQISNSIGQVFSEQEYPTFLASKLSSIYERAGRVKCKGSPVREGSITLLGVVSSQIGDFTDTVTTATLMNSKVFWAFDNRLAKKKHYPAINWLTSHSDYDQTLEPYFNEVDPDFKSMKGRLKRILQEEQELNELIPNVKRDQLQADQILTLEIAKIIREDFLFQDVYGDYDHHCPIEKTIGMMKCIVFFYDCAKKVVIENETLKWGKLLQETRHEFQDLSRMKFQDPKLPREEITNYFVQYIDRIKSAFQNLIIE